jgi:hypothetical protein
VTGGNCTPLPPTLAPNWTPDAPPAMQLDQDNFPGCKLEDQTGPVLGCRPVGLMFHVSISGAMTARPVIPGDIGRPSTNTPSRRPGPATAPRSRYGQHAMMLDRKEDIVGFVVSQKQPGWHGHRSLQVLSQPLIPSRP